jgi:hypothetical protein
VLFSNDGVAAQINRFFEPAWETVRPVPIVRIDFGNGTVLTRTLHGNIASYVCAADGQVFDVLPGIYAANTYLEKLYQLRLLANYVDQEGPAKRNDRLAAYHRGQVEALAKQEVPPQFINMAPPTKAAIERNLKAVLLPGGPNPVKKQPTATKTVEPKFDAAEDVANWKVLVEDTQVNETVRRRQIHEMLVKDPTQPHKLTKWLYKEVLHADLDDPYLGLGNVLFANYPFTKEDKTK